MDDDPQDSSHHLSLTLICLQVNQVNLSLNDQIWGNKSISFCPAGPDPERDCPSAARPAIPNSSAISPFRPFEPATIAFLRHGYCTLPDASAVPS